MGFASLDMAHEKTRGVEKNTNIFGPSIWKRGMVIIAIDSAGKDLGRDRFQGETPEL